MKAVDVGLPLPSEEGITCREREGKREKRDQRNKRMGACVCVEGSIARSSA